MSYVFSAVALLFFSGSYLFNTKRKYLISQLLGNVFLSASYFFIGAYFTTISVALGIARGLICYGCERKNKRVPLWAIFGLCVTTIANYIVVNCLILNTSSVWDILYLVAACLYAVTFAVRNLKRMRYLVLVPHAFAIAYNLLIHAPIFSAISYGIEFAVTVLAIIKAHFQENAVKCNS